MKNDKIVGIHFHLKKRGTHVQSSFMLPNLIVSSHGKGTKFDSLVVKIGDNEKQ